MGLLYVVMVERIGMSPELRLGLMTGVLGAFTTFSAFSMENRWNAGARPDCLRAGKCCAERPLSVSQSAGLGSGSRGISRDALVSVFGKLRTGRFLSKPVFVARDMIRRY